MKDDKSSYTEFMLVKDIVDENFQDYKRASMFISAVSCDFKCMKELKVDIGICQNMRIVRLPDKRISISNIYRRYMSNPITNSVVIGGLEPMLQFKEVLSLIHYFRIQGCNDDFVIYTGYYPYEIEDKVKELKSFNNIIIKYGRFMPDLDSRYDNILGISLSSKNQHAEKIS